MENMVELFSGIYTGKTVLITGHTGFKGSWLAFWLRAMGANVIGFSRDIPTVPSHFELLEFNECLNILGDVTNLELLLNTLQKSKIDLVFHLAAQPLVLYSYDHPLETFNTNIIGTANLLEACRISPGIKGVVIVTSDKCYENLETQEPFIETSPLGGRDPYSASKGCAEIIANSYRSSFFSPPSFGSFHNLILATARSGNVLGGGDWGEKRLLPDIVKNAANSTATTIRNPMAIRPWQHVLEPITGYLNLGQKMLEGDITASGPWNFGPDPGDKKTVQDILNLSQALWPSIHVTDNTETLPHESIQLSLDSRKANEELNWFPVWKTSTAVEKSILWYRRYYEEGKVSTTSDLESYISKARELGYKWAN